MFTTLVFYNIAYNLYIFRQASRRSWRINQTAPKVEVYMLYYQDSMQQKALRLMASKLSAATVIEGNISEEGLAAMSDCNDMTTQLARELISGLKDNADDLAASFKKMALIKGEQDPPRLSSVTSKAVCLPVQPNRPIPNARNSTDTGQRSIFDLLAS